MSELAASPNGSMLDESGSGIQMSPWSGRDRRILIVVSVFYAVLLGGYVVAVLWIDTTGRAAPHLIRGTDSAIYENAARNWPWDPQAARVAPLFPLLLRLVANNLRAVVVLQAVLWGLAWHWFARTLMRSAQTQVVRWAALAVVLGFSLSPEMLTWNSAIASEGLSLSLVVASFACAITAWQRRTQRWWVLTAAVVALATLGRDTNAILAAVIIAVALVVFARIASARRSAIACVVLCLAAIIISNTLSQSAEPPRWFYPLQENIVVRVTPRPEFAKFFTDRGMPQLAELSAMRDKYFYAHLQMEEGPAFAPFRKWLRDRGPAVYAEFVVKHLGWQTMLFIDYREEVLLDSVLPYGRIVESTPSRIFGPFGGYTYLRSANGIVFWALGALLVLSVRRSGWRQSDAGLRGILWIGVVTAGVHAYATFAADAFEVGRHALTATIQLRIVLWATTLLVVDRWLVTVRARKPL